MLTIFRLAVLVAAGFACIPTHAATPGTPATAPGLLAALTVADGAAVSLGAVIDFRRPGVEGVTVLAITPGGLGERLGLRPGDRVLAVNGRSLTQTNRPSSILASAVSEGGDTLHLEVVRDGKPRRLSHAIASARAPDHAIAQGCGHVTTQGAHPRARQDVFPLTIVSVDGNSKLPEPGGYHRVAPGRHVLVVQEHIDPHRFSAYGLQERERQRARHGRRLDKVLIVDVQPGMTYAVGARQSARPIDIDRIRDNSYWEPVVWRSYAKPCG